MAEDKVQYYGLCYRCEHRAQFHETGRRPRMQCGDIELAVSSCYMYKPVAPLILTADNKDDPRPILGPPMLSGRVTPTAIAEGEYAAVSREEDSVLVYWVPKEAGVAEDDSDDE